jgi:hypothetical protein
MLSLTQFEHAIRSVLIDHVQRADATDPMTARLTYNQLGAEVGSGHGNYPMVTPPFRGLGKALGHVCMYEVERGRPMLTALVVQQGSQRPGEGFARLGRQLEFEVDTTPADEEAFWRSELAEVVRVWSAGDPTAFLDGGIGMLLDELRTIKQLLRRGRYQPSR